MLRTSSYSPLQVCDHPCLSELSERSHPLAATGEAGGEAGEAGATPTPEPAAASGVAAAGVVSGAGGDEEGEAKLGLDKLLAGSAKLAMLDCMLQVGRRCLQLLVQVAVRSWYCCSCVEVPLLLAGCSRGPRGFAC